VAFPIGRNYLFIRVSDLRHFHIKVNKKPYRHNHQNGLWVDFNHIFKLPTKAIGWNGFPSLVLLKQALTNLQTKCTIKIKKRLTDLVPHQLVNLDFQVMSLMCYPLHYAASPSTAVIPCGI